MAELPDCQYCRRDERLQNLMIEIAPLTVSTLYLFKEQTYHGRCVVAYQAHVNELFELPPDELNRFMADVALAARVIKNVVKADKINYGAYSDKLAHLHVHLVPKFNSGPHWGTTFAMMPEPKKLLPADAYESLINDIRLQLTR